MRQLLQPFVLFVAALAVATAVRAEVDLDAALKDRVMGDPNAPVTIIEYASMTCPHCASFHAGVLTELKTGYIDTGKAKLVFRDFPLDGLALRASMLARCAPDPMYFRFVDVLFTSQAQWSRAGDPIVALNGIGRMGGLTSDQIAACLESEPLMDGILRMRQEASNSFDVNSTPSFIINGEKHSGALTIDEFADIIDPLVAN